MIKFGHFLTFIDGVDKDLGIKIKQTLSNALPDLFTSLRSKSNANSYSERIEDANLQTLEVALKIIMPTSNSSNLEETAKLILELGLEDVFKTKRNIDQVFEYTKDADIEFLLKNLGELNSARAELELRVKDIEANSVEYKEIWQAKRELKILQDISNSPNILGYISSLEDGTSKILDILYNNEIPLETRENIARRLSAANLDLRKLPVSDLKEVARNEKLQSNTIKHLIAFGSRYGEVNVLVENIEFLQAFSNENSLIESLTSEDWERLVEYTKLDDLTELGAYIQNSQNKSINRLNTNIFKYLIDGELSEDYLNNVKNFIHRIDNNHQVSDYIGRIPEKIKDYWISRIDDIDGLLFEGEETRELMLRYLEFDKEETFKLMSKKSFGTLYGEEAAEKFLSALPISNQKRRNAFTQNAYDRTANLIVYLLNEEESNFEATDEDIEVLTMFVSRLGLSRSPALFRVLKEIYRYEKLNGTYELSDEIKRFQLQTTEEFFQAGTSMKNRILSAKEIQPEEIEKLTEIDKIFLRQATGYDTHRFSLGRISFETILSDFNQRQLNRADYKGYYKMSFTDSEVATMFDPSGIVEEFNIIADDYLAVLENGDDLNYILEGIDLYIAEKVSILESTLSQTGTEKKDIFLRKQIDEYESRKKELESLSDIEDIIMLVSDLKFGKADSDVQNRIIRRSLFTKLIESLQGDEDMIDNLRIALQDEEISPNAVLSIINLLNEQGNNHVFKFPNEPLDEEKIEDEEYKEIRSYWSDKFLKELSGAQNRKRRSTVLESYEKELTTFKASVEEMRQFETGDKRAVKVIPDLGLVGELSGYVADVCYTGVYPLIDNPNHKVIPFKFVREGERGQGELKLDGSVLLFEVTLNDGSKALLVRGFNYPDEESIPIDNFIEWFLDETAKMAEKKGFKYVLVPGNTGAISNYSMTINHISSKYVNQKIPVTLNDTFDFNNYDLTSNTFIARTIN
ncbi:MAG: hypothetical protein Q9M91_01010 [Candidatus Dojkabacteria bacterium]|nr:hypothetical protein [Candidatus Dojkabacteria bacterium]